MWDTEGTVAAALALAPLGAFGAMTTCVRLNGLDRAVAEAVDDAALRAVAACCGARLRVLDASRRAMDGYLLVVKTPDPGMRHADVIATRYQARA